MTLADILIAGLAAWRVALALVNDAGPFDVIRRGREALRADDPQVGLGKLFACVWCMAFWTALGLYSLWRWGDDPGRAIVAVLAIWGTATALDMLARKET